MKKIIVAVFLIVPFIGISQCKKGDCENGIGTYIFKDGSKYVGEWVDGRQEGNGIYTYKIPKKKKENTSYASKYDGEWVNGRQEGNGIMYYHNGTTWTGIFKDGKQLEGCSNIVNCYNDNDIIGEESSISINLTPYNNQYIIKLSFGDIDEDFLFDTGASKISMSYSFLRKLKNNNVKVTNLNIKGFTAKTANNTTEIEYYKIDGLKIGEYTVNNVVVMVGKKVSLLFGTGFLEKFSDWSGPGKKGILKLYK